MNSEDIYNLEIRNKLSEIGDLLIKHDKVKTVQAQRVRNENLDVELAEISVGIKMEYLSKIVPKMCYFDIPINVLLKSDVADIVHQIIEDIEQEGK